MAHEQTYSAISFVAVVMHQSVSAFRTRSLIQLKSLPISIEPSALTMNNFFTRTQYPQLNYLFNVQTAFPPPTNQ